MDLYVEHQAYRAAQEEIAALAADLAAEHRTIQKRVDELLGHGWSGAAAARFSTGWDEWVTGTDAVIAGLHELADALAVAQREFDRSDGRQHTDLIESGRGLHVPGGWSVRAPEAPSSAAPPAPSGRSAL